MLKNKNNNKFKKRLIISLVAVCGVSVLMYVLTLIIPWAYSNIKNKETLPDANFNFYDPDYNENIFEHSEYVALIANGVIRYDDGMAIEYVNLEEANDYEEQVSLIINMVISIMNGDAGTYNSYFSEEYFKENSQKEKFTMQKVYNGYLKEFSYTEVTENNITYDRYVYELKYNIYENNGTFRRDIGDGARAQYIVVTNKDGRFLIDNIMYTVYK